MKIVILFSTHILNDYIIGQVKKLCDETKGIADMYVLLQEDYLDPAGVPFDASVYPFSIERLNSLGYEPWSNTIVPGSNHFPLLQFYLDHTDYDYYWNIEYDVTFTGNWGVFFSFFDDKNEDFITSHIASISERPNWTRWNDMKLVEDDNIPYKYYMKSFNPIYRISNRSLKFLDVFLKKGNRGHHELLIPTVLDYNGFSLGDLGGNGRFIYDREELFYTNEDKDRYYTSSMRFSPSHRPCEVILPNKLYHPIKEKNGNIKMGVDVMEELNRLVQCTNWLYNKKLVLKDYAVDEGYMYSMINILNSHRFECILDLGCGQTSFVLAQYVKGTNRRLLTIESDRQWGVGLQENYADVDIMSNMHYYKSFTDESSHYIGLNRDLIHNNIRFDFISVDGPLGYKCEILSRTNVIDMISNGLLADQFVIMFHDTNRSQDNNTVEICKLLLENLGIEIRYDVSHYGKGTTILTNIDDIKFCL